MPKRPLLKPRKSPSQARSAVTIEIIVEAAARILEARGIDGYTTNAVAEKAGVSIGSLYQYFPNKDALTLALIRRETAILRADVEVAKMRKEVGLVLIVRAAVAHQMRRPALARLLDAEEARLPIAEENATVLAALKAVTEGLIAELVAAPPPHLSNDVLAIIKGMTDAAGARGEADAAFLEARVAQAVFGYLGIAE